MSVITDEVLNSNFPLFDLLYNKTDQREECSQNELIELVENLRKLFTNRSNIHNIQNVYGSFGPSIIVTYNVNLEY